MTLEVYILKQTKKILFSITVLLSFLMSIYLENISYALEPSQGKKVVYLTFDDAPGDKVTDEILDVLKENNIKATFFIVGNRIKGREEILKRICSEGHGMGLHTYTHNMRRIYSSHKIFIDEMLETQDEIFKVTGRRTYLIRFPGGSKPQLNKAFLNQLHELNLKVYDWNVPLSDGINCKIPPSRLYNEGINMRYFTSPIFILMHCSGENGNTCIALPKIIKYYKEQGYEFKAITENTPEYFFRIKK